MHRFYRVDEDVLNMSINILLAIFIGDRNICPVLDKLDSQKRIDPPDM